MLWWIVSAILTDFTKKRHCCHSGHLSLDWICKMDNNVWTRMCFSQFGVKSPACIKNECLLQPYSCWQILTDGPQMHLHMYGLHKSQGFISWGGPVVSKSVYWHFYFCLPDIAMYIILSSHVHCQSLLSIYSCSFLNVVHWAFSFTNRWTKAGLYPSKYKNIWSQADCSSPNMRLYIWAM